MTQIYDLYITNEVNNYLIFQIVYTTKHSVIILTSDGKTPEIPKTYLSYFKKLGKLKC